MTAPTGYAVPSVTITDPYTGSACPSGKSCKAVSITSGSITPITLMLANW